MLTLYSYYCKSCRSSTNAIEYAPKWCPVCRKPVDGPVTKDVAFNIDNATPAPAPEQPPEAIILPPPPPQS